MKKLVIDPLDGIGLISRNKRNDPKLEPTSTHLPLSLLYPSKPYFSTINPPNIHLPVPTVPIRMRSIIRSKHSGER